jgi:hypothetical protein
MMKNILVEIDILYCTITTASSWCALKRGFVLGGALFERLQEKVRIYEVAVKKTCK